ncbi:S46 family peptidase [Mariniblastus fucicola]|uniref:Dipeptidyl-peptidase n=1 Tax=Mariniblastus fucicola TaxID=980251 RepID=A0A5B9P4C8_9BACT|nr:S46 family peptidase [Mariniblastus fucicola]QEG21258.1 Peptidase S46 [Mariniblastus fucicola]
MNRTPLVTLLLFFIALSQTQAEEGMFPISSIDRLGLSEKGMQLTASQIFNPDETCLLDGICRVNGCTGSFVSDNGLIITNHHCAYRAIQSASTAENDWLKNGFFSQSREQEIPAPGYVVRITESYRDVSAEVLAAVDDSMSATDRSKAIEKRRKELEKKAEEENAGMRADIAEMFTGKTYVLFLYTYIRDVRLVFAPPSSVGNFGGAVDNWEWPRHTGDFSFMRAYVAPDGSMADYDKANVPYQPKRHIQVSKAGANEGDFVFLLGYPGRTARHKTASFLEYEQNVRLPYVVDLYQWQIATMDEMSKNDRGVALKHSSRKQSLANVEKRSRGQLKGLRRANIVAKRRAVESQLQNFIDSSPDRKQKYGSLLKELDAVYSELGATAKYRLTLNNLVSACRGLGLAYTIYDAAVERAKSDLDREAAYMDRNYERTVDRAILGWKDWHRETDMQMLTEMKRRLRKTGPANSAGVVKAFLDDETLGDDSFAESKFNDESYIRSLFTKTADEIKAIDDPFLKSVIGLYPEFVRLREQSKEIDGRLGRLYGELIDVKQEFQKTSFVPDANGTLRMTYGNVKGYSPEDAVYKSPATTLRGVIEKTTGEEPFITPDRIQELYEKGEFEGFLHPTLNQVPVALLYNTDTTGGNSGSPILNGRGQLVGVNFDRAFEATINDFAWNESYSRSIGVDIRYVLWITGKVYQSQRLLDEMGVE